MNPEVNEQIPEPQVQEFIEISCPVEGCDWHTEDGWGAMPMPEEYVKHYREAHS